MLPIKRTTEYRRLLVQQLAQDGQIQRAGIRYVASRNYPSVSGLGSIARAHADLVGSETLT